MSQYNCDHWVWSHSNQLNSNRFHSGIHSHVKKEMKEYVIETEYFLYQETAKIFPALTFMKHMGKYSCVFSLFLIPRGK